MFDDTFLEFIIHLMDNGAGPATAISVAAGANGVWLLLRNIRHHIAQVEKLTNDVHKFRSELEQIKHSLELKDIKGSLREDLIKEQLFRLNVNTRNIQ